MHISIALIVCFALLALPEDSYGHGKEQKRGKPGGGLTLFGQGHVDVMEFSELQMERCAEKADVFLFGTASPI
jgi:hypothetical protein